MPRRSSSAISTNFARGCRKCSALFDPRNLFWLLLAIGAVKVLHELGHALACKHFGGEVHELGFMLLVFAPCLYCDVSDAWRLPSKWQRIAVSAAGMVVELVLAALATIVWWYAQPGVVQLVALNIMIVCTVSTLLVNGNPLLRYDGYYILSDLVETPNLWQRSREVLRRFASEWLLGEPAADDPLVPARTSGMAGDLRGGFEGVRGVGLRRHCVGPGAGAVSASLAESGVRGRAHRARQCDCRADQQHRAVRA